MPPKSKKKTGKGRPATHPLVGLGHLPPNYIGPACRLELYTEAQVDDMLAKLEEDDELTEVLQLLVDPGGDGKDTGGDGGKKKAGKDAPEPDDEKEEANPYKGHVPDELIPEDIFRVEDMEAERFGFDDKYTLTVVRDFLFSKGYTLAPMPGDGDCMMHSIINQMNFKSEECQFRYQPVYMRRQVVAHVCLNIDIYKDFLRTHIRQTYGGRGGDEAHEGPFSVQSYLKYIKTPGKYGDAIFIVLICSMWGLTCTVVRSDSCGTEPYRHQDLPLDSVDFVLVFNCNMYTGHYTSVRRVDKNWLSVGRVIESRGFDPKVDEKERMGPDWEPEGGKGGKGRKGGKGGKGGKRGKGDDNPDDDPDGGGGAPGLSPEKIEQLEKAASHLADIRAILKGKKPPSMKNVKGQTRDSSSENEMDRPAEVQVVEQGDKICNHCEREFSHTASLRRHINKNHKNKYLYRCTVCNKGLTSLDGLREHMKIHEGKRHKCNKCDKTFGAARALHKHDRETHAVQEAQKKKKNQTEFRYKCKYCKGKKPCYKGTDVKRYFDAHVTSCRFNPNKPNYKCDLCDKEGFSTNSQLLLHKKRYHNW